MAVFKGLHPDLSNKFKADFDPTKMVEMMGQIWKQALDEKSSEKLMKVFDKIENILSMKYFFIILIIACYSVRYQCK